MRLFGLTLALLASSLGARAESVEDRMTALEQQVKTLQEALRNQSGNGQGALDHFVDANQMVGRGSGAQSSVEGNKKS